MNPNPFLNISLAKLFPQDNQYWRVTLVGAKLHQSSGWQPEVTVYISKLSPPNNKKTYEPLAAKNLTGRNSKFLARIGYQSLLYIGSVWRNGINVSDEFKYDKFDKNLDTSLAKTISFNQKDQFGQKILPSYPLSTDAYRDVQSSTLIAIPYKGDPYGILIPVTEIIRFYYLTSSSMSQAVYHGVFDKLTEGEVKFDPVEKHVEFTLSRGVSERNAALIARYHSSPYMQDKVKGVYQWVQLNSVGNPAVTTHCNFFPFSGRTNLRFQGLKIQLENKQERILCTRLLICSGPMSFRSAIYNVLESKRDQANKNDDPIDLSSLWPMFSDDPDDVINPNEEPSNRHATKTFVDVDKRFSSLQYCSITSRKIKYPSDKLVTVIKSVDNTPKEINTGDGTNGDSNTRKAELDRNFNPERFTDHIPERLQMFFDVINSFRTNPGWKVNTIPVTLPREYEVNATRREVFIKNVGIDYLNGLFKLTAAKNTWAEFKIGGDIKHRGIVIAEIQYNEKIWYLFDLEADPGEHEKGSSLLLMHVDDGKALNNEQLYTFMERCVSNKGWPSSLVEFGTKIESKRFKHKGELKERLEMAISG